MAPSRGSTPATGSNCGLRNEASHLSVITSGLACRYCSLFSGLAVKLSTIILAGPTVLSAVGVDPPHDGVR